MRTEIKEFMKINTFSYIHNRYIEPLVKSGQMKLTLPDKPRSAKQQYQTVK